MTRVLAHFSTVVVAVTILAVAILPQRSGVLDPEASALTAHPIQADPADPSQAADARALRAESGDGDRRRSGRYKDLLAGDLSEEFIAACLEVAERIDPDYAARLRLRCDANPSEFAHMLRTSGRHIVGLVELRDVAPDLFELKVQELKLDAQVRRTVNEIRAARASEEQADMEGLLDVLRNDLTQQAMLSLRARALSIERMKEQIQIRERELMRDRRNLGDYVEHRMERLLNE